jgi:hypothetical protein
LLSIELAPNIPLLCLSFKQPFSSPDTWLRAVDKAHRNDESGNIASNDLFATPSARQLSSTKDEVELRRNDQEGKERDSSSYLCRSEIKDQQ